MVLNSKIILYIFLFQCIIPKKGSNSKKRPPKKVDQIFFFADPPKNSQIYFCQKLFFSGIKTVFFGIIDHPSLVFATVKKGSADWAFFIGGKRNHDLGTKSPRDKKSPTLERMFKALGSWILWLLTVLNPFRQPEPEPWETMVLYTRPMCLQPSPQSPRPAPPSDRSPRRGSG